MSFDIKKPFSEENIEYVGILPYGETKRSAYNVYEKRGIDEKSLKTAIIFAIPYYTESEKRNISAYASGMDYHYYTKLLEQRLKEKLKNAFANGNFYFFSDNSPIDERHAAKKCNIGFIGKNGLVITEKYSSFIFLGEILTDIPTENFTCENPGEISAILCDNCDLCRKACPKEKIGQCLSALTQKKGVLSEDEEKIIIEYGSAWGCDICQNVCPYTKNAIKNGTIFTPIKFFSENTTPYITYGQIKEMPDEEFSKRAYAWRKKDTLLRNLELLEKRKK